MHSWGKDGENDIYLARCLDFAEKLPECLGIPFALWAFIASIIWSENR
jgi:hypothetical protein